jgi:GAF domain-containing protein
MLGKLLQMREKCLASAAEARERSRAAGESEIKASYCEIERQWLRLAQSYEFLEEANRRFDARPQSGGFSIPDQLDHLISIVAQYSSGEARSAFFRVSECGTKLHHVTGMPDSYARAVDGFAVSPASLGCGLAASTNEFVLHPDVLADPRWEPWLDLASIGEFRSCWSFPVHGILGPVVGTFAMYFNEPRRATVRDLDFATTVARCGGIILSSNSVSPRQ